MQALSPKKHQIQITNISFRHTMTGQAVACEVRYDYTTGLRAYCTIDRETSSKEGYTCMYLVALRTSEVLSSY